MKTHIASIAIGLGLLVPATVIAAADIEVENTIAGLGTQIVISGVEQESATLFVLPPYGIEIVLSATANKDGTMTVQLAGAQTQVAGTYEAEVVDNVSERTLVATSFDVLPESLDPANSTIQLSRGMIIPDGEDRAEVEVILRDQYGNTLPSRPVKLISNRSVDTITPLSSETDVSGMQRFAISTYSPGIISIRAIDLLSSELIDGEVEIDANGSAMGGYYNTYNYPQQQMPVQQYNTYSNQSAPMYRQNRLVGSVMGSTLIGQMQNGFDVVESFIIEAPDELNVNEDATIRITAVDQNGRQVEDYTNVVLLSSTDPTAILPLNGEVPFRAQNLGEKILTLGLRFRTPGEHILLVQDSADSTISAQVVIRVIGSGTIDNTTITITSHEKDSYVNTTNITLEGKGSPFSNVIVTGGVSDVRGETDSDGAFSIPVELNDNQVDHTLRVRDESGLHDSGNLHLMLDNTPPEIELVTFSPVDPEEEGTLTLVVESESDLASVTVNINDEDIDVPENKGKPGTYELIFNAPVAGNYQPVVTAVDAAGNETDVRSTIIVKPRSLQQVQNVTIESKVGAVALRWDPMTAERVDAYRIYVGEDPENFLYTLDTNRATAAATVEGLNPGSTYFFAVTALQGDRESSEKSEVVQGSIMGVELQITEQQNALLIEWAGMPQDTPLASYILEYGTEPDVYVEKRIINGELRAYNLRDLISGITYYLRLTPVATTSDVLSDLSATGVGTPKGSGFTATPAQTVPVDTFPTTPPISMHGGAPSIPTTGIPLSIIWIALGVGSLVVLANWYRRRTLKLAMKFLQEMESRYHE